MTPSHGPVAVFLGQRLPPAGNVGRNQQNNSFEERVQYKSSSQWWWRSVDANSEVDCKTSCKTRSKVDCNRKKNQFDQNTRQILDSPKIARHDLRFQQILISSLISKQKTDNLISGLQKACGKFERSSQQRNCATC